MGSNPLSGREPDWRPERPPDPILTPIPLVRKNRTLSFERRIRLWLLLGAFLSLTPAAFLLERYTGSVAETLGITAALGVLYLLLADLFFDQLLRPLQTLANIVSAIREQDYSFRARGARRGDTVGDLALEINALSSGLQLQRAAAQDALTLLERVLTSMHSPVLAFDPDDCLRLVNSAARAAFSLDSRAASKELTGLSAAELQLEDLLAVADQGLYPAPGTRQDNAILSSHPMRYAVRRTTFRLNGVPHTLLVLSDVAAVLREEERLAWQRLIRVLSHEINNSLTPIHSIAGSLRALQAPFDDEDQADLARGLSVIEERAASLHRFLQSYQRLTHLPAPNLRPTSVNELASRTAQLETRLAVDVLPGPAVTVLCDPDQVQQALINLLQNAVDAALSPDVAAPGHIPAVTFGWTATPTELHLSIEDNGPGIDNPANLFVPFYTTKPKGSGIGLALAQQIATAHHGSIALLSPAGRRGCSVRFTLPLSPPKCRSIVRYSCTSSIS